MGKTTINVDGEQFLINGQPTYSELEGTHERTHGLLMNARFIQGLFDDRAQPERFARFGWDRYNPDRNTAGLIAALPEWYAWGLRAFTVGLQGGGPCYTVPDAASIDNNPFGSDGTTLDPDYAARLDCLIQAADRLGMAVIVSFLYQAQAHRFQDGGAIRRAISTAARFLRQGGYSNVIVEVANEHTIGGFRQHPLISSAEGMAYLIELAKKESGLLVGCSPGGGEANREVNEPADIIFIHGNGCSRQHLYELARKARSWNMNKPIVCNEDSPCIGQLAVTYANGVSWGYYNNMTKQEPPCDWGVTEGEDRFFAHRMAEGLGITVEPILEDEQYVFQGFERQMELNGKRWLRLASLYPETIDHVDFFRSGVLYYQSFVEPFFVNFISNWKQASVPAVKGEQWTARIHLRDGRTLEREGMC